jgi:hypothetical protein
MMLRKHSNVVSLTLMMLTSWRKFLIFWGFSLLEKSCLMVILSVSLTQQSFIDSLLDSLNMSFEGQSSYLSPYRSGLHIDSIPCQDMSPSDRDRLRLQYHSLVGSLNWLAHTTHPDLSTIVSLLAQYQSLPSQGHYDAALYVVKYLATTRDLGLYFTILRSSTLESFLHFPIQQQLLSMSDANWGPQDASLAPLPDLPFFVVLCRLSI